MTIPRVANLRSKQGRKIRIEYVIDINPASGVPPARDVIYLAIFVDALPHERATAVLIDRFEIPGDGELSQNVYITELTGDDGVFKGFIPPPVPATIEVFSGFNVTCMPQIAIVIDGVWQTDPVQQGEQHDFNFAWLM